MNVLKKYVLTFKYLYHPNILLLLVIYKLGVNNIPFPMA